jgi:choline kinase/phosphatidylglycerophosphate synthase
MADTRPRAPGMGASALPLGSRSPHPTGLSAPEVGLVLAAGRSQRLSGITGGRSKALSTLGGRTLLERAVRTLMATGLREVIVVVGYEAEAVAAAVGRLEGVRVILAEDWELGNAASLAATERALGGEDLFVVMCGDHVFAEGAMDDLLAAGEPAVLVDPDPVPATWDEGTRVRIVGGRAIAFGKELDEPAIDCGVFVLGPEVFDGHRRAAAEGDHSLAGALTRVAQAQPLKAIPLSEGDWWQDVDTPGDLLEARSLVRRSLGKPTDGPVSRHLNRPISTRITMAIAPLRIHPDLLSVLFFVVGIMAAWSLSAGRAVVGGILTQAASVLDGVDGETARLRGASTSRGARLDALVDRMVDAAVVAGLGLWLWKDPSRTFRAMIIAMSAGGWALIALTAKWKWKAIPALEHSPATERKLGFLLGGRDGRLFVMAGGAVVGRPELGLVGPAVAWGVTVVFRTVLRLLRPLRGAAGSAPAKAKASPPKDVRDPPEGDLEEVG